LLNPLPAHHSFVITIHQLKLMKLALDSNTGSRTLFDKLRPRTRQHSCLFGFGNGNTNSIDALVGKMLCNFQRISFVRFHSIPRSNFKRAWIYHQTIAAPRTDFSLQMKTFGKKCSSVAGYGLGQIAPACYDTPSRLSLLHKPKIVTKPTDYAKY
jgi:hypothetical protein